MASREERALEAQRQLRRDRAIQQMQSGLDAPARDPSFKEQWQSFGVGAKQAFTLGWGDEIMGALWASFSPDLTREQATERVREAQREAMSRAPTSATVGGFAGGASIGPFAIPGLGRAATFGSRQFVTQPIGGAATGFVAGAGEAPTIEEIPEYGGQGAMFGGAAGTVFPALAAGATRISRAPQAMRDIYGGAPSPKQYTQREIAEMMAASGFTPEELRERFATMGPNTTLADVLGEVGGEGLRQNLKTAEARGAAARFLRDRQMGERDVLNQESRRALGVRADVPAYEDLLMKQRRDAAQARYDAAYTQPVEMTEPLKEFLSVPEVQKAYTDAVRRSRIRRQPIEALDFENLDAATVNFQTLDEIKRALDDRVRSLGRSVEQGKGSADYIAWNSLRDDFRKYLTDINDDYAVALRDYAGDSAMLDAMDEGRDIFSNDVRPRDVSRMLENMSQSEQLAYRMGVYDAIERRMEKVRENANAARDFMTDDAQQKMDLLAGSQAERFAQQARGIQQRRETASKALGGSNTARDLVEAQERRQRTADAARLAGRATQVRNPGGAVGLAMDVVSTIFRRNKIDVTPEQRAALAEALLSRSPEVLNRAIKEQYRGTLPPVQLTRWANRVANSLTGAFANPTVVQQAIRGE